MDLSIEKYVSQIRSLEKRIIEAMKNADIAVLEELIDDGLVFYIPGGLNINKQTDLEGYRSGQMKLNTIDVLDQDIHLHSNVAVVNNLLNMKGSYKNLPIAGKFRVLRVWKQVKPSWKVIAGSSSIVSESEK